MKRILLTSILSFVLLTQTAHAINCSGGTATKTADGKIDICISNVGMNWYTAWAWCDAHGLKLASIPEVCNTDTYTWTGETFGQTCLNLKVGIDKYLWSTTPRNDTNALRIHLNRGGFCNPDNAESKSADQSYALCISPSSGS